MADDISPEEINDMAQDLKNWAVKYAAGKKYKLNPDEKHLNAVLKGLAKNTLKFGSPFCPCRVRSGNPAKDKNIICPCVFHANEIEEKGMCHCQLFFK